MIFNIYFHTVEVVYVAVNSSITSNIKLLLLAPNEASSVVLCIVSKAIDSYITLINHQNIIEYLLIMSAFASALNDWLLLLLIHVIIIDHNNFIAMWYAHSRGSVHLRRLKLSLRLKYLYSAELIAQDNFTKNSTSIAIELLQFIINKIFQIKFQL